MTLEDELANVEVAYDMIWNCKLEMAEQLLSSASDALSLHALSEIAFMKAVLSEDKNEAKVCFARTDAARKQAERVRTASSSSFFPSFLLLLCYLFDEDVDDLSFSVSPFRISKRWERRSQRAEQQRSKRLPVSRSSARAWPKPSHACGKRV